MLSTAYFRAFHRERGGSGRAAPLLRFGLLRCVCAHIRDGDEANPCNPAADGRNLAVGLRRCAGRRLSFAREAPGRGTFRRCAAVGRRAAAGAAAAISSESWVVAQQAISRLQATRAPLTDALADIDRLYLERSIAESVDGLPEIYALRDKLAAMLAAQDNVLAGLERQLPGQ